jgi:hypothetical protein
MANWCIGGCWFTLALSTAPPDKPYGENISFIREGKLHRKEEEESVGQNEPAATNALSTRSLLSLSCE